MARRLILNEELPPDLRQELERDARELDVTLNDAANSVLAEHFKTEWKPSGSHYRKTSPQFKLRVPDQLHRKIRMEAARNLQTVRGVTLSVLSEAYGTTSIDPHRRPRRQVA